MNLLPMSKAPRDRNFLVAIGHEQHGPDLYEWYEAWGYEDGDYYSTGGRFDADHAVGWLPLPGDWLDMDDAPRDGVPLAFKLRRRGKTWTATGSLYADGRVVVSDFVAGYYPEDHGVKVLGWRPAPDLGE